MNNIPFLSVFVHTLRKNMFRVAS